MTAVENARGIGADMVPETAPARIKARRSDVWPLMGIGLGLVLTVIWTAGLLGLVLLLVI